MSLRADKGDAQQFRKPGRSGSSNHHHRGFSGTGGKGGGGGGPAGPPLPLSSAAAPAAAPVSASRSFKKSGNGQGPQPRVNPVNASVEPAVAGLPAQNGTHSQAPSRDGPAPAGNKPVDPRNSKALPKAPTSQPAAGAADPAAQKAAPSKGDASRAFNLQFGTIGTGIMNGMQIPARTSSAPPNLDEQRRDQAGRDSFRAAPTLPMPTAQKQQQQQQQQTRKDVGVNPSRTAEPHPPTQLKRDAHIPVQSASTVTAMRPSVLPITPMNMMHMPFQQPPVPLQFGGPNSQMQSQGVPASSLQITMTLPPGNASQVPQQMFISGIHSHPLQSQAIMHQGQNLGFTPQMGHQLSPQIGMGIGFPQQFSQQKPGKFGGAGQRKNPVKITHPDTHEELRLDKRTDTHMDGSSGQRQLPSLAPQVQPIPTFNPSHQMNYYQTMQPSSYNNPQIFFSSSLPQTSTQMTTGSQNPRYGYPVSQGGQAISFVNPSVPNPMSGSKPGPQPSLHNVSEAVKLEGLPVSAPSASVQVTMKSPVSLYAEKIMRPSVTISAPISKAEPSVTITAPISKIEPSAFIGPPVGKAEPSVSISPPVGKAEHSVSISPPFGKAEPSVTTNIPVKKAEGPNSIKPSGVTTVPQLQMDRVIIPDSSFQQPKSTSEPSDKKSVSTLDSNAVASALLAQRTQPGISSSSPGIPVGDSAVMEGADSHIREPVRRSESFKEHQKKPGKKDIRHTQQQQPDAPDPAETRKLPSPKMIKGNSFADVVSQDASKSFENSQAPLVTDLSVSNASLPSSSVEHIATLETGTSETIKGQSTNRLSGSSGVMLEKETSKDSPSGCSSAYDLTSDGASIKQRGSSETLPTSSDSSSSSPDGSLSAEVLPKQEMLEAAEDGKAEVFDDTPLDSTDAKGCPVSTRALSSIVKEEEVEVENSEKAVTCELNKDDKLQPVTSDDVVGSTVEVNRTAEESDMSANISMESVDAETVPSSCLTSTVTDESKLSPSDVPTDESGQGVSLMGLAMSASETANIPTSTDSETTDVPEHKTMDMSNEDPVSIMLSEAKDKLSSESTRTKTTGGKKKKRKEILSKADAAGASDLYNAYKGPEKKQGNASNSGSTDSSLAADSKHAPIDVPDKDDVGDDENEQDKAELEDWEDAADISTPKLKTSENEASVGKKRNHVDGDDAISKKYTRDFLLTFAKHCNELPMDFNIGSDISDALMSASAGASREPYPSSGRITDRPSGGSRGDRRMGGMMDDGKWAKSPGSFGPGVDVGHGPAVMNLRPGQGVNHGVLRNPRGQQSNQFAGGILSGPTQSPASQGPGPRNNADADRWARGTGIQKGLMPSPQTPLQVMHKAEKKYEVGKVSDQEEAKRRQLKGILNKLTPQNFEKLFEQVKEVNIDSVATLTGVISQIFDKALMEPTFCEMYANFCFHLAGALPDFCEDNEKINFRRLLLNKCQEEFERGEREQAEADKVEEEGEIKQSEAEREEKRLRARRRMLGNIRLIGELYKKKMLTERIMHECITKLLGQYQNPDEEDIEALCKLMATIGEIIDHSKAKIHMDAYFDRMQKLSVNMNLSSRVRFMLKDSIDLRKNKWQQRRKVEGPKKIEEVHRDAAQERHAQSSRLARGPVISSAARRGPPADYGPRGSAVLSSPSSQQSGSIRNLPSQARSHAQDVRFEDRHQHESRTLSVPLPQRHIDDGSITLGPQGGLARGMSIKGQLLANVPAAEIHSSINDTRRIASGPNGHSSMPDRARYNSRNEIMPRSTPDRLSGDRVLDRSAAATLSAGQVHGSLSGRPNTPEAKPLSEDTLREMSLSAIREFYSAKNEDEVALCVKELNSPSFYPSMVSLWVTDSFERKDMERDLLAKLLVKFCKSPYSLLSHIQLIQGFESALLTLEDDINDAPRAGEFLGHIFAKAILENVVSLNEIGGLIREGGEEPGRLLDIGLASEVLGSILELIRIEKGDSVLNDIRTSSNLRLQDFRPPHPGKSKKLDAFL